MEIERLLKLEADKRRREFDRITVIFKHIGHDRVEDFLSDKDINDFLDTEDSSTLARISNYERQIQYERGAMNALSNFLDDYKGQFETLINQDTIQDVINENRKLKDENEILRKAFNVLGLNKGE